jgi:hypothetical protein
MLNEDAFEYLVPAAGQKHAMDIIREASKAYALALQEHVPPGADRTHALRLLRWSQCGRLSP